MIKKVYWFCVMQVGVLIAMFPPIFIIGFWDHPMSPISLLFVPIGLWVALRGVMKLKVRPGREDIAIRNAMHRITQFLGG